MNNTDTPTAAYSRALAEYGDAMNRYSAALSRNDPAASVYKDALNTAAAFAAAVASLTLANSPV